jgi:hypothetical protein
VLAWLEAGLDGHLEAPRAAPSPDLEQRLATVEARLDAIAAPRPAPPARIAAPAPAPPNQAVTIPQVGDAITTKALADLLQMRRGTLNARIARAGGALPGLVIEGWCCLGTQVPKRGGPAQALWQQV